ncbi:MAG: FliM/FliN family flagellar motor switch protein [Hyphococcus sp.]
MTKTEDSAQGASALLKKVKAATFDMAAYPMLQSLAEFMAKAAALRLSDAAKSTVQSLAPAASMESFDATRAAVPENTIGYWFNDGETQDAALIAMTPQFASAISETLLGGAFALDEEGGAPTALDAELGQIFAGQIVDDLNMHLVGALEDSRAGALALNRTATSPKAMFDEEADGAVLRLAFGFKLEDAETPAAVTLCFPADYLEKKGLLATAKKAQLIPSEKTKWYETMLENIHHTEIELPVILATHRMTLSDLSRLKVDQMIPLEDEAHNNLDIILKTDSKTLTLGKARLGKVKKQKAAKLTTDVGLY